MRVIEAETGMLVINCSGLGPAGDVAADLDVPVLPATAKLIESPLQVARYTGITLVCATQSPSNRVFGGTTDGRQ